MKRFLFLLLLIFQTAQAALAAPLYFDRVWETSTTTGTGDVTLSGTSPTGYRNWSVVGNGNTAPYLISGPGGEWERGIGTWNTGNTLSRTTVISSSNSNSAVNFSAGTKQVYLQVGQESFQFTTGTSGTDFNIGYTNGSPVFNIPDASIANRGLITTGAQTIGGTKTIQAAAIGGREYILKTNVSDGGNDIFYIGNGTTSNGIFVPTFGGYVDSTPGVALLFRGMTSAAQDTGTNPIVQFQAMRSSSTSDPNNASYTSIATRPTFQFVNVNTVQLHIAADGKIGIGTASPSDLVHLESAGDTTLRMRSTSSTGFSGQNLYDDSDTLTGSFQIGNSAVTPSYLRGHMFVGSRQASGALIIVRQSGATETARFTSGGLFGIGNAATAPATSYLIHAANSSGATFLGVSNQGTSAGNRQLRLGFGNGETHAHIQGTRLNTADDVNIVLQPGGGNVGLAQTSFGTSANKVFAIGSGTAPSTSPADAVQMWSADRGGTAGKAGLHIRSEDGTSHVFSDFVGIGTTSPTVTLEVAKTGAAAELKVNRTDGFNATLGAGSASAYFEYSDNFIVRKASAGSFGNIYIDASHNTKIGAAMALSTTLPTMYFTGDGQRNVGLAQTTFGTSAEKVFAIGSGTAPSTSPADAVQMWSADRGATAGKAGLHIRSEDGTEHVFSDYVGIGTTSPIGALTMGAATTALGTGGGTSSLLISTNVASPFAVAAENCQASGASGGAFVGLYCNDGVAMAINDRLGGVVFGGSSSASALRNTAAVIAYAEQAWTDGSAYGTYLTFETNQSNATSRAERMRVSGAGNIGIGQTTFGTNAVKVVALGTGTAPSTSPADAVQMWSADRGATAGAAGLHIRSEDGTSHVFSDRVGLRTTAPSTSIHMVGTTQVDSGVGAGSATSNFEIRNGNFGWFRFTSTSNNTAGTLSLTNQNSGTTPLVVDGGATVGVGISVTPSATLHVDNPNASSITAERSTFITGTTVQTLTDGTTIANWRNNHLAAPTLNGVAAGGTETVTNAATFYVNGAPTGSDITITNSYSIWSETGAVRFDNESLGTTSTDGLALINNTAATVGAQQYSPRLRLTGQGWKTNATAASQTVDFIAQVVPVQGAANPTSYLDISSQVNAGGYTNRFTIESSGDVGIGTTSPSYKLSVVGTGAALVDIDSDGIPLQFSRSGRDTWQIQQNGTGDAGFNIYNSTDATSRLFIDEAGEIGIGTISPAVDLDIAKSVSGGAVQLRVWNTSDTASSTAIAYIATGGASAHDPRLVYQIGGVTNWVTGIDNSDNDIFKISNHTALETNTRLALDTSGNIGIGQTTFGTSAAKVFAISSGTAPSTSPADAVQMWSADTGAVAGKAGLHIRTEDGTSHVFGDKVGIGNTSPGTMLDVTGDILSQSGAINMSPGAYSSGNAYFRISDEGSDSTLDISSYIHSNTAGNAQPITFRTSNSTSNRFEAVRIANSGNVGIGDTSPDERLEVAGEIMYTNVHTRGMTRTVPLTIDDAVDIGSFTFTSGAGSLWMTVVVPSSNHSICKHYSIPIDYSETSNVWTIAQPISDSGPWNTNNFEIDVKVNLAVASLRLRRTAGTDAGTAYITIRQEGVNTNTFAASTTVNSVTAPTTFYNSTVIRQVEHDIGIGVASPLGRIHVRTGATGAGITPNAILDDLVIESDTDAGISLLTINTEDVHYGIGDSDDNFVAGLVYRHATDKLELYGNNAARVNIDSSGNVGIGQSTFGTSAVEVLAISSGTAPSTSPADAVQMWCADRTAGEAGLFIRSEDGTVHVISDNVGINDSSPNCSLSIGNNLATNFLDTYAEYQLLLFDAGTSASSYGFGVKSSYTVLNSNGGYSFDKSGTSTSFIIDPSANVGIGQTTFGTSAAKVLALGNGTAPSTSPTDAVQMWSADYASIAGDARLHVRGEGATVVSVGNGNIGSSAALGVQPNSLANGQALNFDSKTELTTIAAAATTDTTITIPANAVVYAVTTRVTVAIPTATTFDVGISGATTRYGTGISTALNTTSPGTNDATRFYSAATAIRITPNLTPATNVGRLRVTIFYYTVTPATS